MLCCKAQNGSCDPAMTNPAMTTNGGNAQEAEFAKFGRLTQPAGVFCCGAARRFCPSRQLRGSGAGGLMRCRTDLPFAYQQSNTAGIP